MGNKIICASIIITIYPFKCTFLMTNPTTGQTIKVKGRSEEDCHYLKTDFVDTGW